MNNSIKKYLTAVSAAAGMVVMLGASGNVNAALKDDVLSMTGNCRTIAVWVRWPWCDSNYTPVKAYDTMTALENENSATQLMVFDTYDGKTRYLDSTLGCHVVPRINRAGTHAVWIDEKNKTSWIRDLAGLTSKRKLISGGNYFVVGFQWNSTTKAENVLVESADELTLYRVPFKPDYTVDTTQKVVIYKNTTLLIQNSNLLAKFDRFKLSVSEDIAYIGCALPWPSCMMINTSKKAILSRKADGAFGCEPNIAPDNSYRFFHNRDDHTKLRMWDANLSETAWDVVMNLNVPIPGTTLSNFTDCAAPRWTNNNRYFTNSIPLQGGYEINWGTFDIFKMTAAQVKVDNPSKAGFFLLGKFSADFKTVEKYVRISDGDIRHRDVSGDGWVDPVPTKIGFVAATKNPNQLVNITYKPGSILVDKMQKGSSGRLLSPKGVVVKHWSAVSRIVLDTRNLSKGLYVVSLESNGTHESVVVPVSQ